MIILQETGFVVLKPKALNLEVFKEKSKIADGLFASEIIEKIYNALINKSKDIKSDYDEYFSDEFGSFDEFLSKRYSIDEDCINLINDKLQSHCILFQREHSYGGYDNFIDMLFSDEIFERINGLTEI